MHTMAATRGTYGGEAPLYYGERFDAEEAKVTGSAKTDEAAAEAEIAALFMNAWLVLLIGSMSFKLGSRLGNPKGGGIGCILSRRCSIICTGVWSEEWIG